MYINNIRIHLYLVVIDIIKERNTKYHHQTKVNIHATGQNITYFCHEISNAPKIKKNTKEIMKKAFPFLDVSFIKIIVYEILRIDKKEFLHNNDPLGNPLKVYLKRQNKSNYLTIYKTMN